MIRLEKILKENSILIILGGCWSFAKGAEN